MVRIMKGAAVSSTANLMMEILIQRRMLERMAWVFTEGWGVSVQYELAGLRRWAEREGM